MAHERAALGFGNVFGRRRVQTLGQISYDGHVVGHVRVRDLLAAAYAQRGSDGLAKLAYKFARRNLARCETMAGRHGVEKFYHIAIWQLDFQIGERCFLNHGNIVAVIDDDRVFA